MPRDRAPGGTEQQLLSPNFEKKTTAGCDFPPDGRKQREKKKE
jgi:hypothetical protein